MPTKGESQPPSPSGLSRSRKRAASSHHEETGDFHATCILTGVVQITIGGCYFIQNSISRKYLRFEINTGVGT